jgi:hypothetical protein
MGIRCWLIAVVLAIGCLSDRSATLAHPASSSLPVELDDREFWTLTERLSEPNGYFRSDNFLSNERGYQVVIPDLVSRATPGGVYLGVGPEQNFPYIVAVKAHMAFIIDIRRGNLHEQLLYKALFELSTDRADFLSRLFSRPRPDGLSRESSVEQMFDAYNQVPASERLYKQNLAAVVDRLTKTHRFPLEEDDRRGIAYVYHEAFYSGGPNLNYSIGRGGFSRNSPSYEELMLADDGHGENRGYLATEESFAFLKNLESRNLLIPVVGNFSGPKAIRAVGRYIGERGGTVSAFYLSNVEQFLRQNGTWDTFCASVATLPLDDASTFIYSSRDPFDANGGFSTFGFGLQTRIRPILSEVRGCSASNVASRVGLRSARPQ